MIFRLTFQLHPQVINPNIFSSFVLVKLNIFWYFTLHIKIFLCCSWTNFFLYFFLAIFLCFKLNSFIIPLRTSLELSLRCFLRWFSISIELSLHNNLINLSTLRSSCSGIYFLSEFHVAYNPDSICYVHANIKSLKIRRGVK